MKISVSSMGNRMTMGRSFASTRKIIGAGTESGSRWERMKAARVKKCKREMTSVHFPEK
jgi:hypothetical protein